MNFFLPLDWDAWCYINITSIYTYESAIIYEVVYMGLKIVLTMNIKHNRYILFIGPLVWALVSLSTPRSLEASIFTLWFVLTNLYDMLEISHNKIFNYTPAKISKMRTQSLEK